MRLQLSTSLCLAALATLTGPELSHADESSDWRINTDTLIYSDTDNVVIVSPQVAVHHSVDDDGGTVGARVVVDAVSAASVDVVSQATNRFSEVRTEADFNFSKAVGKSLPSVSYRYSHEPDYVSHGVGVGLARELGSSDTMLSVGYDISLDTVGYHGTPQRNFSESVTSHGLAVTLTQVLSPKTLVRGVYTLSVQQGYLEKPYRFVPLFDAAGIQAAKDDGVEINLSNFDKYRLSERPAEEVPDFRVGHAFSVRGMHYLDSLDGSLRLDYQFYVDDWGVAAHMLEPSLYWKRGETRTWNLYSRVYYQQAAWFWKREYVVMPGTLPHYRTMDRDLSSYLTLTGGLRYEWKHGALSLYGDGSAMDTFYSDYIYLKSRVALIGQVGLRWAL